MSDYQVIARKYRPQKFADVIGQDSTVKTLINAIKHNRLAHAYLFCGTRGTGKTTLARVFAKALNCENPDTECEPCNNCQSCKEISASLSIDVLEIDGASNRGIDDVRKINENVSYTSSSGRYKVYIIDEVHMLTKDAFNALLKTLEEPPPKVIFFFATTEPQKVIPTIISRCQRFNLNRIPTEKIISKLQFILEDLKFEADEDALRLIANRAEGGLRDAESLLDQILAFHDGKLTEASVATILGVMPRDSLFELDIAGKEGDLAKAFIIADQVFSGGKDLPYFIEMMTEHFRNILLVKLSGINHPMLSVSESDRKKYGETAKLYRQDQCITNLEYLIEMQTQIRVAPSARIALEALLLHIMRSHHRIPVDILVRRLADLEEKLENQMSNAAESGVGSGSMSMSMPIPTPMSMPAPRSLPGAIDNQGTSFNSQKTQNTLKTNNSQITPKTPKAPEAPKAPLTLDDEPAQKSEEFEKESAPIDLGARPTPEAERHKAKTQSQYDTLLQFAAVELDGKLQKK